MADAPQTWTNTYRGADDAAMIGAFVRDAAAATAAGWSPVEQTWGDEGGARVLVVRYLRTGTGSAATTSGWGTSGGTSGTGGPPASTGAGPGPTSNPVRPRYVATSHSPAIPGAKPQKQPATPGGRTGAVAVAAGALGAAAAGAAGAAAAARGTAKADPRRGKQPTVTPSRLRSLVANVGAGLFAVGFGIVALGPTGGALAQAGFSAVSIGFGTWLASRVALGLARRSQGIHTSLGSPVWVAILGLLAAWTIAGGILRFPAPAAFGGQGAGGDTVPSAVPAPTEAPASQEVPVEEASPVPPEAPFALTSPESGATITTTTVEVAGTGPAGDQVRCSHGSIEGSGEIAPDGTWSVSMPLDPGFNLLVCQLDAQIGFETVSVFREQSGPAGVSFTLSGSGADETDLGPFVFPPGEIAIGWSVGGPTGCLTTMTVNPESGATRPLSIRAIADTDGSASGAATLTVAAEGGYVVHLAAACDTWSISFESMAAPGATPAPSP